MHLPTYLRSHTLRLVASEGQHRLQAAYRHGVLLALGFA